MAILFKKKKKLYENAFTTVAQKPNFMSSLLLITVFHKKKYLRQTL